MSALDLIRKGKALDTTNTIVALSSGAVPSGVAVVRISGPECEKIISEFIGKNIKPRRAELVEIKIPKEIKPIDEGIVLWFPGPNSFTGEDCLEFQLHGSRAIINDLLDALISIEHVRLADAGEFSRRAFENGKMDLTEIEGLSDLIIAETREQRLQAYGQQQGGLRVLYSGWRERLIHLRAMIEAELDFSEEEDVPEEISEAGFDALSSLIKEVQQHLYDNRAGEIIRDGYQIVLLGKPNSGKSSLLNAISKREVAIVTDEPGTTRDIISVDLDIDGYSVRITDTAGLRDTENKIELEGMRRASDISKSADMIIWLQTFGDDDFSNKPDMENLITVISKDDERRCDRLSISVEAEGGIEELLSSISNEVKHATQSEQTNLISRKRYRDHLAQSLNFLELAINNKYDAVELRSEDLRLASEMLSKITGHIDVEDMLDVIFSEFCIGK